MASATEVRSLTRRRELERLSKSQLISIQLQLMAGRGLTRSELAHYSKPQLVAGVLRLEELL